MKTRVRLASVAAVIAVALFHVGAIGSSAEAGSVTASALPGLLTVQGEDTAHHYDRDLFQQWIDADGDGCDTRYEALIEESATPVTVGAGCSLDGGTWVSSYDNATWTDPADVDIDHMVPLAEAWRSGAWAWTTDQRKGFANDLDVAYVLLAVTDNVNQSKSDQDPAEWMPPYAPFQCEYVIDRGRPARVRSARHDHQLGRW